MSDFGLPISGFQTRPRRSIGSRKGFTFTEVLFAVMLLGIGFIMVAAIFPVAIQQSQANREDTTGVILAKRGAKTLEAIGFTAYEMQKDPSLPVGGRYDGIVHLFDDYYAPSGSSVPSALRYTMIIGNLVDRADPRYAWVPLGYKLGPWPTTVAPIDRVPVFCEVYLVGLACRNKAVYDDKDTAPSNYTFQPKVCTFFLTEGNDQADTITFTRNDSSLVPYDFQYAAEGAYVLVADDHASGVANGRMYRLGVRRTDKGEGVWELTPGKDMTLLTNLNNLPILNDPAANENIPPRDATVLVPTSGKPATGFMIGRAYQIPSSKTSKADGPAQDLFGTSVIIYFPMQ